MNDIYIENYLLYECYSLSACIINRIYFKNHNVAYFWNPNQKKPSKNVVNTVSNFAIANDDKRNNSMQCTTSSRNLSHWKVLIKSYAATTTIDEKEDDLYHNQYKQNKLLQVYDCYFPFPRSSKDRAWKCNIN